MLRERAFNMKKEVGETEYRVVQKSGYLAWVADELLEGLDWRRRNV